MGALMKSSYRWANGAIEEGLNHVVKDIRPRQAAMIGGAAIGGTVGAVSNDDNRVLGSVGGAGLGAVGGLGAMSVATAIAKGIR